MKCVNCVLFTILLFTFSCFNQVYSETIDVDLSGYRPGSSTNIYQRYVNLTEDTTKVKVDNIGADVGFFIIQVHSYVENVTLSYNATLQLHSFVTGTNIGLIYGYGEDYVKFYIFRDIKYRNYASVLLVITIYGAHDPVPGGCNLSFTNMVAPYQIVSYNEEYITVNSQPPYAYGVACENTGVNIEMYHMFLSEYDNTINTYFDGITKMLTVENIRKYGRKVPSTDDYSLYHRLFSSYRGTGEVFAIIARHDNLNATSAYVPAVSYGCDMINWQGNCVGPVTRYWKFMCALLLIFGLLICFFGHKLFKFTLFMLGFAFGVMITYFIITLDGHFTVDEKMITSIIIGFFYGITWLFIWWKFGVPLLSVHLNFILAGFLIASIICYAGLADLYIFRNDMIFWLTFISIMLACIIIWAPVSVYGHIFGCSFLGSYAFFTALNYYLGGNLPYIIINTYRRASVRNFNNAVISPPFQVFDIIHSVGWIIMVITGCYVQIRDQKNKPPFPPNRNGIVLADRTSERTMLIPPENVAVPQYV